MTLRYLQCTSLLVRQSAECTVYTRTYAGVDIELGPGSPKPYSTAAPLFVTRGSSAVFDQLELKL